MPSPKFGSLSVGTLKEKLARIWRKHERTCRTTMAPLLFHLRDKLKAQGKTGAGFGAWVEDTLDISRRTADRWADAWSVAQGLKKPSKRAKPTFRQMSKSGAGKAADGKVVTTFSMALTEHENAEFLAALRRLGKAAQRLVFETVVNAARPPKKPEQSTSKRETAFLDDERDATLLGGMENLS